MCDLQNEVHHFNQRFNISRSVEVYLLDLAAEVGELSQEYLRLIQYGEKAGAPVAATPELSSELGDVLYSLLSLINTLELDAGHLLSAALTKYESRLRDKGSMSSHRGA